MKLNITEKRDTFAIEELLPEGKEIEIKAMLMGYEKTDTSNKNSDKPKLR